MDNPPEKSFLPTTTPAPADDEPAGASDAADFKRRLEQFEAETRRRRKYGRRRREAASAGLTLVILCFAIGAAPSYGAAAGAGFLLLGLATVRVLAWAYHDPMSRPSADTMALTKNCNAQAVGPLLSRLRAAPTHKEVQLIWQTIADLLDGMLPDEADALPSAIRVRFNDHLAQAIRATGCTATDVKFCLAWLKVLERIGDSRELRLVKSLSDMGRYSSFYLSVEDAARDCLPHIAARIAAREPGKTLLRASESDGAKPEFLLRSVMPENSAASRELLRPAESDQEAGEAE